ncbi:hypothetical protein HDV00_008005 [Rhizophlyctis rosea]|nr:hypothetical protein HDV00_008005 [Rhizophlyctis rosea]
MSSRIATRLFSSSARALSQRGAANPSFQSSTGRASNPSNPSDPLQTVKNAAKASAFKADGSIGQKFTEKGSIGSKIDKEVGGPFSAQGSIGKQFTERGAVGSTGQKAAEKVEDAARNQQRKH